MKILTTIIAALAIAIATGFAGTATLKAPTAFPIIVNGKPAGSAKLPAGTKVEILQQAGDKALVKANIGEAWVEAGQIEIVEAPAPKVDAPTPVATPTATATPELGITENGNLDGPDKATKTEDTQKKILVWGSVIEVYDKIVLDQLAGLGYETVLANHSGYMVGLDGKNKPVVGLGGKNKPVMVVPDNELKQTASGYDIVLVTTANFIRSGIRNQLRAMHREQATGPRLLFSRFPKEVLRVILEGTEKEIIESYSKFCQVRIIKDPSAEEGITWVIDDKIRPPQWRPEFGEVEGVLYFNYDRNDPARNKHLERYLENTLPGLLTK